MINIKLDGHHFEHDVFELVRVFYPEMPINFIDEHRGILMGIYIESIYDAEKEKAIARIYESKEIICEREMKIFKFEYLPDLKNPEVKVIKASIYEALSVCTGRRLPWGILTGIRPVKIGHKLLQLGMERDEANRYLMDLFKLDKKRSDLVIDIANNQLSYLDYSEGNYSLYINIPFCPSVCVYCSFPTVVIDKYRDRIPQYVDRIIEEIHHTKKIMGNSKLYSVYIGGGTPSSIPNKYLASIIKAVREILGDPISGEFTVECGRADTINTPLLRILSENGVNRISINPQTMNDSTLKIIGRKHDGEDIIEAFNLAKRLGIENINMDLIVGLPNEGIDDIKDTFDRVLKLDPENITVHTLSIKKGSHLRNKTDYKNIGGSEIEEMINYSFDTAIKNSYTPYYLYRQKNILGNFENIGYSKKSKACIYNILSMEEIQTIVGIGMGAVSKFYFPKEDRIERVANFKSLDEYLRRFHEQIGRKENALDL
ncbi:MAG: coproporphyrinogen dehydrogenase HemZ [Tissierellia bacterium]|nr:coproporphyrinogen dehydrogenase HemZ [Tissierellia bacterium]